ncbi:anti-sigma-D factor RsdA [Mycobacterium deserti]|uniref:Anti-sigma-D factor RsdA n=1 Tax=Mycobacterium deserti TaxID=2978347 RepID=A0ABT2M9G9_9MYCO|nr:anti-sigma-D factor RsdA [Mycobacterium deserti]MCT7658075.1 anti-sigma-D factor RsdA [Mycobacterium deserti]
MPDFGRWTGNGGDPSLNDINRTDRFLDSLAFAQPVYSTDSGEAELANLMAGWRDEVRTPPLKTPITPRDAVVALDRATATRRRTRSLALVGSTAAAVLCLGGFVSVVAGAGPGDTLYGLHTMLFGEDSPRNDSVMLASQQLAEVQQLIDEGQWDAAQNKLQTLTTTVATVNDVEQKQELVTQWQELTVKVEAKDAAATIPPNASAPEFPDVPVIVLDTPTTTAPSSDPTLSPSTPLPTPTPSTPLPTPSGPLPTPSTPLPSPSTPLPSPSTPLPTPTQPAPRPTPLPTPTQPAPRPTPLPTPTVAPPLPTATATVVPTREPVVIPTIVEPAPVQEEEPTPEAPPVIQAPAPQTAITTTVVVPEPDNEPRGQGRNDG